MNRPVRPTPRISTTALLAVLAACASRPALATEFADPTPLTGDSALLTVYGLACPLCATNVDQQLMTLPGVDEVQVDLALGQVTVTFTGAQRPSRMQLAQSVHRSGITLVGIDAR